MATRFQSLQSLQDDFTAGTQPDKEGCSKKSPRQDDNLSPSADRVVVLPFLQATSHSFEVDSSLQLIPFHQVSAPAQIDPMLFKAVLAPALLLHARVESTEVVIEAPINHTAATARIDGQLPPLAGWTARPPPQVPPLLERSNPRRLTRAPKRLQTWHRQLVCVT
jgi:hypothetical protein